jgi:hypothetical protein
MRNGPLVHLSVNEQALFNVIKASPKGITCDAIMERVFYRCRTGDAYKGTKVVHVTAHWLNKKIAAWGLKVVSSGGAGSTYYLVANEEAK